MRIALVAALCLAASTARGAVGVRVLFGLNDAAETVWDGSATVRNGRIVAIEPWRFEQKDAILPGNSWRASTHRIRLFQGAANRGQQPPMVANGVFLWLEGESDSTVIEVKTQQGSFEMSLGNVPFGRMQYALDKRVGVDRVPGVTRLSDSPDEQDYPAAAAAKDGSVWMAYLEFQHHPDHHALRAQLTEKPRSYDDYRAAPPGDRVFARRLSNGQWGPPIAVTPAPGDLYRPAIAVDAAGRAWVFWSANQNGNFDLYAAAIENGKAGAAVRLTSEPGSDVFPAATADSQGRVWVAWQGWRNGRAAIFAAMQQGAGFSKPQPVSNSTGNEWNPAIAADNAGGIAVVWDSYRNGNYDIYVRTAANGSWGRETAFAATARYEAYPSAAYDRSGRLWVAYEEGGEGWGKDFGAYETSGLALYQGRAIRLRALEKSGQAVEAAVDLGAVLPGAPAPRVDAAARQSDTAEWATPDLGNARNRASHRAQSNVTAPRNTAPRLTADASGRLWLAFRSAHPTSWHPIGTVWSEYVASYNGQNWIGSVFLAHSDNLLDNRPALASVKPGELTVIHSSDHRRRFDLMPAVAPRRAARQTTADPYQNDLYASTLTLPPAGGPLGVRPAAPMPAPAKPDGAEAAVTARSRAYRMKSSGGELRLVRGEFHRHSEVSADGGSDGTLLEQWRYMFDPGAMDWVGCCDHDNGGGREYTWWTTQKLTDIFHNPGAFIPMFSYERSVPYPEGHRNVVFAQRGIRPLPRLPKVDENAPGKAPDTLMLYEYLRHFNGVAASHTSGTNMGTDWRDNDPVAEPMVEIYQGERQNYERPEAPRTNTEGDSIGGWRPKGFIDLALEMGYKLGFQASSDHISTHMSYCNLWAKDLSRESILEAFQKRHIYGATDDILAEVRSGDHMMGDIFDTPAPPEIKVKLVGTAPFAKVHIVKDNRYVYSIEPGTAAVEFTWRDNQPVKGKQSYYYVRGEQKDGEIVWASPLWITWK